jgi:hypothetical protein
MISPAVTSLRDPEVPRLACGLRVRCPFLAATQACATEAALVEADFVTFTDREAADFDAFAGRIVWRYAERPTELRPSIR